MQIIKLQDLSKDDLIELILKERQEYSDILDAIGGGGVKGRLMARHPAKISKGQVRRIALSSGFTLKDGDDLKPYVYQFADALINESIGLGNAD